MRFGYDIIVLDLELNDPGGPNEEILEIGAVELSRDVYVSDRKFSRLVKLSRPVSQEISALTGITQEEIDALSCPLSEVIRDFQLWAKDKTSNVVLAGWGNDVSYLRRYCEQRQVPWPFRGKSLDLKSAAIWLAMLFDLRPTSDGLSGIMRAADLQWDDLAGKPHRALPDALNTARLMQNLANRYKSVGKATLTFLSTIGIKS